jgi:hypothetical protein
MLASKMNRLREFPSGICVVALAVVGMLAGCKSAPLSQYISPRVEGRVSDATSQQPLKNVEVRAG